MALTFFAVGYQADLLASFFCFVVLLVSSGVHNHYMPNSVVLTDTTPSVNSVVLNRIPLPAVLTGYHSQWY